jgi:hypothetical protein
MKFNFIQPLYTLENFITCENGTPSRRSTRFRSATLTINQLLFIKNINPCKYYLIINII